MATTEFPPQACNRCSASCTSRLAKCGGNCGFYCVCLKSYLLAPSRPSPKGKEKKFCCIVNDVSLIPLLASKLEESTPSLRGRLGWGKTTPSRNKQPFYPWPYSILQLSVYQHTHPVRKEQNYHPIHQKCK